jgi:SAM-dependent methyltransferase
MIGHSRGVSKASGLGREIRRKFRDVGFWETLELGARKLVFELRNMASLKKQNLHPFDLRYGTDTSGIIEPWALDIPADMLAHAVRYQSGIVEVFLDILHSLPISYEEFLFIDLGSGKGRALLLASQFPFKEIVGVEISPNLHRIACNNIQIYKDELQRCNKLQSVREDAAHYELPNENIVFYLFNPFDEYVMCAALSNIEDSIHRYPRDIYIAYLKPVHRHLLNQAPFLLLFKETERYVIYKNKPLG